MDYKKWTAVYCWTIAAATILGAFGAHALEKRLTPEMLDSYKTGIFYLFINAVALLAIGKKIAVLPQRLIFIGTLLFSISIFLLSTRIIWLDNPSAVSFLGPVTPLGGSLIIIGWIIAGIKIYKQPVEN